MSRGVFAVVVVGLGLICLSVTGEPVFRSDPQFLPAAIANPEALEAVVGVIVRMAQTPLPFLLCAICGLVLLGRDDRIGRGEPGADGGHEG